MALREKGRYFELPIEGSKIQAIVYSGTIRLFFGDSDENHLDLIGQFEVEKYGQTTLFLPESSEALLLFHDLLNAKVLVKEAKADKQGHLFLTFANTIGVTVKGPSECWQFTRKSLQNPQTNISVSGGLGYLDF